MPALRRLDRVSRGQDHFADDRQLRACIALARLAPQLLADSTPEDIPPRFLDPEFNSPERQLAGRRLEWLRTLTPEQDAQFDKDREAALKAWEEARPKFKSAEERMEYYKTHKPRHISEVEDELWPPHLRRSTLKAKETSDE
jgi:hypothetical protein